MLTVKTELRISGMTCASCAQNVRRALKTAGTRYVDVDWRAGRATLETDGAPQSLVGTFPACDDAPLARALLRELAKGLPVTPAAADTRLAAALARWPNIERDQHGRVVAFMGLSITPTAHRFMVGGPPA